ncbi:hypothetical protein LC087_01520 [Bacillus carboniphilus]|uniref:NAD(P)-dependent oxidoreductase n=1 Tax=Bacillus carboniphilus TaxID=86663 RepID=A0ABY9JU48_9BACI|nr:hypothetical protein [Bacillus carboniphilus]WLR42937.1 hypothetical protein LC087_01520 [Bacillus carboniphilus]
MKKVLILGVEHFIGIQLANKLLEEDVQVDGLILKEDHMLERGWNNEALLFIGRNSFFTVKQEQDLDLFNDSYDDIYMLHFLFEGSWFNTKSMITKWLHYVYEHNPNRVMVLSTYEIIGEKQQSFGEKNQPQPSTRRGEQLLNAETWLDDQLSYTTISHVFLHIPTVFGPWQPPNHWISECIISTKNSSSTRGTKIIRDVLYIDEVLNKIIDPPIDGKNISYFLSSQNEKRIQQFIELLNSPHVIYLPIELDESVVISVPTLINIEKGVQRQKEFLVSYKRRLSM